MRWGIRGPWGRRRRARRTEEGLQRALRRVLEDELDEAEELLSAAARGDSERVDVYLALARLYRRRGEIGRAIRVHQNLLLRPELGEEERDEALRGLAADFQRGGFLQRAIAAYEEVLARHPRDRAALAALARLRADARDHQGAIALERRLARIEGRSARPREAELLVQGAETALAEGRRDDAHKLLRRALRRDRECARAWLRLGELEAGRGRTRRAIAAWRRVPALDRRLASEVYAHLEGAFASQGRPEALERFLRELIEERPGDVEARLALARMRAARGDTDAALAELSELEDRGADDLRVHVARGRILREAGRDAEASKALGELLERLARHGPLGGATEGLE